MESISSDKREVILDALSQIRTAILNLTIILSFVFGGGEGGNVCDSNLHCICEVAKYSLSDATSCATNDNTCIKDATTHPEEKGSILADGNDLAVLLGSANPGRRTQPSIKTSFRTIKFPQQQKWLFFYAVSAGLFV